ncbi:thiamine diphosphokinase [Oceanobacillus caeni]|uniref:thiamine diphosphokinase n=1 Tax=Oceanobacillus caeni TaxID=405946 RepID=UPI00195E764B|nr:thiamine diphosphokinase [Oceanobacillus caeni]MBU8790137.1 thiamine diphosphokinase [Oceanobacillus caeni]MCR1833296.1 thiamine diphosphokinase [Oceanobacillus caeni]
MAAKIGIVGNGPIETLPDLKQYKDEVDVWIGADRGALYILNHGIKAYYAVGDFDSVNEEEKLKIKANAIAYEEYPAKKDETDLELAIQKAFDENPSTIYLFGFTGGRLDHELINIQLLYRIRKKGIRAMLIDYLNEMELTFPGEHSIKKDLRYRYISFIPFSQEVEGLTLTNFYYPLQNKTIHWGSTLCISNELISNSGTFFYEKGILLVVKSRSAIPE